MTPITGKLPSRTSRPIWSKSPERVPYRTGEYDSEGRALWADRPWDKGERAEYCRTVLNREPGYQET